MLLNHKQNIQHSEAHRNIHNKTHTIIQNHCHWAPEFGNESLRTLEDRAIRSLLAWLFMEFEIQYAHPMPKPCQTKTPPYVWPRGCAYPAKPVECPSNGRRIAVEFVVFCCILWSIRRPFDGRSTVQIIDFSKV